MPDHDRNTVIVDTSCSPHARLKPVPVGAVRLRDGFWEPRRRVNREATLPAQYRHCEETGRLDNFRRASGRKTGIPFQGIFFNDSDVYKWLEAVAWTLADGDDPTLTQMADAAIDEIAAAQQPDGYLNTYFTFERAGERWTNLKDLHELYCAGHLLQSAVAYRRATGKDALLQVARRFADYICSVFGPEEEGKRPGTCGHEELEMAMVELSRETGDPKYLRQARYFVDVRGRGVIGGSPYCQDHKPFREVDRLTGHAVRQLYLTCGAADVASETGEREYRAALDRLWENLTEKQMYVSGGVGSRWEGEAFGKDFELPNERAYTETCAAIGGSMWAWRMLALEGDARYADVMETMLYNAILPGWSLDGQSYFYQNPLTDDGAHRRQPWFGCACCPPNVARLVAQLPGYFYSISEQGVWTHLYAEGAATVTLPDGRAVSLRQETRYPWDGDIAFRVEGEGAFSLFLRVPGWCETGAALEINGQPSTGGLSPGSYAEVRRTWTPGDMVRLRLPMPVRRVECHPYVAENGGRVALMRGPLLYCVEQADLPGVDPRDLVLPADAEVTAEYRTDLLGGVVVLTATAQSVPPGAGWQGRLYRSVRLATGEARPVKMTAIPYYAWANREPGRMQVWIPSKP